jgi:predicted RNA-binding Zn-ribbon protein involved in translation (DUF1610 family)
MLSHWIANFSSSLSTPFYLQGEESYKIGFIMLYYVYEICFFRKLISVPRSCEIRLWIFQSVALNFPTPNCGVSWASCFTPNTSRTQYSCRAENLITGAHSLPLNVSKFRVFKVQNSVSVKMLNKTFFLGLKSSGDK